MSRITRVEAVSRPLQKRVVVTFRVDDRQDLIRVNTDTDLATGELERAVQIHWAGTGRNDLAYAEEFAAALHDATRVVRSMEAMIASPDDFGRGDGQAMIEDVVRLADYQLALYAMLMDYEFAYRRDRVVEPGMSSAVVDLEGLRKLVVNAASGVLAS